MTSGQYDLSLSLSLSLHAYAADARLVLICVRRCPSERRGATGDRVNRQQTSVSDSVRATLSGTEPFISNETIHSPRMNYRIATRVIAACPRRELFSARQMSRADQPTARRASMLVARACGVSRERDRG